MGNKKKNQKKDTSDPVALKVRIHNFKARIWETKHILQRNMKKQ